jgi:hypothetical protein
MRYMKLIWSRRGDAVALEAHVALGGLVEVEVVLEAGAAAAHDLDAEGVAGLDRLGVADLADLRRCGLGDPRPPAIAASSAAGGGVCGVSDAISVAAADMRRLLRTFRTCASG